MCKFFAFSVWPDELYASSVSRELSSRSKYCMSETSPLNPTTEVSANVRRRLTSVNRARDPYEAVERFRH